jgi:hypothetical protein
MEEIAAQTYCQRAALELAALVKHQRRPRGRARQQSALLWRYIQEVLSGGIRPDRLQEGPWTVGTRKLKKPGRGGLPYIPFVERGRTVIMVSTPGEAEDLAAFLNYCGTDEFTSR